jgi:hypothetical protein
MCKASAVGAARPVVRLTVDTGRMAAYGPVAPRATPRKWYPAAGISTWTAQEDSLFDHEEVSGLNPGVAT